MILMDGKVFNSEGRYVADIRANSVIGPGFAVLIAVRDPAAHARSRYVTRD
jgi:hypothetical protein